MQYIELKIRHKLAMVMITFAMAIISILSFLYYFQFKQALQERVYLQLSSVKQLKVSQIQHRIESIMEDFTLAEGFIDLRGEIDGLLIHTRIDSDTIINGYHVGLPTNLKETQIQDISLDDPEGKITLALLKKRRGVVELAIVQPDIQNILLERTGLGETGESYLVGEDMLMRSSSRFFPNRKPTGIKVDTRGVQEALSGNKHHGLIHDYRGVIVFSAYELFQFHGLSWVILSEIDEQEALFPLKSLRDNLIIVLIVVSIFVLIVSYEISRQLVKPVILTEQKLKIMAQGVFDVNMSFEHRRDEIGQMYDALKRLIAALRQTVVFADEIGSGNFQANYDLLSDNDKLGTALLGMKDRLQAYQENEKQLKLENQRSLISGEEKERERLSKELHDGLGPMLTILRIKVESSSIVGKEKVELLKLFDETLGEMRKISNNLMPSVLTDFGAGEAIRNMVKQVSESTISIRYLYDKNEKVDVPLNISRAIYRVAQEAINNVLKHSNASKLNISLTEFPDRVSLYIQDDGNGFDTHAMHTGNGLRNMRERVNVENGIFEIISDPKGSVIEVEIPIS